MGDHVRQFLLFTRVSGKEIPIIRPVGCRMITGDPDTIRTDQVGISLAGIEDRQSSKSSRKQELRCVEPLGAPGDSPACSVICASLMWTAAERISGGDRLLPCTDSLRLAIAMPLAELPPGRSVIPSATPKT